MKRLLAIALVLAAGASGCGGRSGPPPIPVGDRCAACGMAIRDLHFASEREVGEKHRAYDAIECLFRDARTAPGGPVYLPDYDTGALHAADSLWVVKGTFPTPMDGGLAAFLDRASADAIAAQTAGRVGRFAEFLSEAPAGADSAAGPGSSPRVAR